MSTIFSYTDKNVFTH